MRMKTIRSGVYGAALALLAGGLLASQVRADDAIVNMNDGFVPRTVTVPAGASVIWSNNDGDSHAVTSDQGLWDSGDVPVGGVYSVRFDTPGVYPYNCPYHEGMVGTVVVE